MNRLALALCAAAALAGPSSAQVGRPLPADAELSDFAQTGASSLEDFVGRTVLIEFFAHWCPTCRESAVRLNGIHDRFGDRGLSVIAVTEEGKSSTRRFLEEVDARYSYAFDRSGALKRELGISSFPTAALIDPAGTVVWMGNTLELDDAVVGRHLEAAFPRPLWEWPKAARGAVKALGERRYGRALEELEDVDDAVAAELRHAVRAIVRKRVRTLDEARERGDHLAARRVAEALLFELDGLSDERSRAERLLDEQRADDEVRRVIKLQEKLETMLATRLSSTRDVERLIHRVESLRRQAAGTFAARQAEELLRELRARLR